MTTFSIDNYKQILKPVIDLVSDNSLDQNLQGNLNSHFPSSGKFFNNIVSATHAGIEAGELCKYEASGIKFGRVIKPCDELKSFSVDVVYMSNIKGPHHRHPQGEIDLIMPITPGAKFDGNSAGWLVYGPDSAHYPTVTEGEALILYLLPNGKIEFTSN